MGPGVSGPADKPHRGLPRARNGNRSWTKLASYLRAIITGAFIATILICRNWGDKCRAKAEPKNDLDGKKKRENLVVLPCPKDPRAALVTVRPER